MRSIPKHPIFVSVIAFSKNAVFTTLRTEDPWKDFYALPEAPLKRGETDENCALRVLKEASGLTGTKMKFIGVHTALDRIEKTRSFIFSYLAMQWTGEIPLENCRWLSDWQGTQLAFEHNMMILEAEQVIQMANKSRLLYAM